MEMYTFKGGVHPPDMKSQTKNEPVKIMPVPNIVVIPVIQHIGAPSKVIVKPGDYVYKGQPIAEPSSFVSVFQHSSISGTVKKIEPYNHSIHVVGRKVLGVCIESDGKDALYEGIKKCDNYNSLTADEIKEKIKNAGIVGMGGATFPTHVKLSPPDNKKIDTVIINAVECEPYLTSDHRLMLERTHDLIEGLKLIMKVLNVKKGIIGVESNKPGAFRALKKMSADEPDIEVMMCELKYPQGGEVQLISAILDRTVPSGGLPMDIGVVVHNVGTAIAIYEAVCFGMPLIDRIVTVTGYGIKKPSNLKVRIGTIVSEVIDFCGGYTDKPGKIVVGGPMMGFSQYTTDVPVIKGMSGIIVFPKEIIGFDEEGPCLRCAKCIDACPQFLMPQLLNQLAKKENWEESEKNHVMDCKECGCCSYICPAKIKLVQRIKLSKAELQRIKREKKAKLDAEKGGNNGK